MWQLAGLAHRNAPRGRMPRFSREHILGRGVRCAYDAIGEPFITRRYVAHYHEQIAIRRERRGGV